MGASAIFLWLKLGVCTNMHDSNDLIRVIVFCLSVTIHSQKAKLAKQKKTPPDKTPLGDSRPQHAETFGGYDCKFVEPFPSVFQTDCAICRLILRDPHLTSCCGNNFCHTCSKRLQADHKPCPTCRKHDFKLYPNQSLGRSLKQLHVSCTHSEDGCEWIGELADLEHHLSEVVHSSESF